MHGPTQVVRSLSVVVQCEWSRLRNTPRGVTLLREIARSGIYLLPDCLSTEPCQQTHGRDLLIVGRVSKSTGERDGTEHNHVTRHEQVYVVGANCQPQFLCVRFVHILLTLRTVAYLGFER
ncbi:MAG: hypothetical protein J07HX64_03018 [halophilic archaeon J07HX64]|nr:MAG: hypothetical protein J07HX64_03018 [halophilic archaeon J07HX64]